MQERLFEITPSKAGGDDVKNGVSIGNDHAVVAER